ncbi:MAG: filamentous hemagglutinin, partial [Pseudomonadota bacterium]
DDAIFQGSGVVLAIDQDGQAAFEGGTAPDARIAVEQGAELVAAGGGRIVILAPEVINEGRIETPDGQALLAASTDRVFLQASDDNGLRGLLVEVDTGGTVTNLGDIVAERGNITLAGLAVNQQGNLTATTSVRSNGSIRLLARDQAEAVILGGNRPVLETTNAGTLTFGEGSVTQVLPELDDPELAVDEQAQGLSFIEAMGRQVTLQSNSTVLATGGDINIQATVSPRAIGTAQDPNDAQIFLAEGAVIDASGDESTVVAMERNVVEIELRGNELADAPLQRDSVIRGEAVRIDVRVGTPLANVDGALDSVERGVGERLASGGTITLGSEGSVVVNDGAVIDVSGGQVRYEDGIINTTQLVSNGQVVDIGLADPNVVYDAIATDYVYFHERWGVTETFPEFGSSQGRFEAGYVEGLDAGSINILAPDALLNGRFIAGRTVGRLQRLPTDFALAKRAQHVGGQR